MDELIADTERPFAPPKQRSSMSVMILFWIAAGLLLYRGSEWWSAQQTSARHTVQSTAVRSLRDFRHARRNLPRCNVPYSRSLRALRRRQWLARRGVNRPSSLQLLTRPRQAPVSAGTIYLCKAYNGGTFWSQAHCNQHQALIDSIVSVPTGMPFEQQVELAQQRRREVAQTVYLAPAPAAAPNPAVIRKTECQMLDRHVEELDAMARQPHSGQTQDWIRGERKAARDRQFALRC